MQVRSLPGKLFLAMSIVLITAVAAGKLVAFNPQPDPPGFSVIGFDPNETARLNVSCPNIVVNGIPPGPCDGTLQFMDAFGTLLKSQAYVLKPGTTASLDLTAADVQFGSDNRFEGQACLSTTTGRALASVEVFDVSSGKTDVYVNVAAPRLSLVRILQ